MRAKSQKVKPVVDAPKQSPIKEPKKPEPVAVEVKQPINVVDQPKPSVPEEKIERVNLVEKEIELIDTTKGKGAQQKPASPKNKKESPRPKSPKKAQPKKEDLAVWTEWTYEVA